LKSVFVQLVVKLDSAPRQSWEEEGLMGRERESSVYNLFQKMGGGWVGITPTFN
jgi:hypothetical protein